MILLYFSDTFLGYFRPFLKHFLTFFTFLSSPKLPEKWAKFWQKCALWVETTSIQFLTIFTQFHFHFHSNLGSLRFIITYQHLIKNLLTSVLTLISFPKCWVINSLAPFQSTLTRINPLLALRFTSWSTLHTNFWKNSWI